MYVARVSKETGEIEATYERSFPWPEGGSTMDDGTFFYVKIPKTVDIPDLFENNYWDFEAGDWAPRTPRPSPFAYWTATGWTVNQAEADAAIRKERDRRLRASDFTQLADVEMADPQAWVDYRQALRDVPLNNQGVSNLDAVDWPVPPS